MATEVARRIGPPGAFGQLPTYPIDYIGPFDQFHYIYNGEKFQYPGNVNNLALQENFLKLLGLYRNIKPEHLMSARDKEVRTKMIKDLTTPTGNELYDKMIHVVSHLALIFLSIVAIKYRPRL